MYVFCLYFKGDYLNYQSVFANEREKVLYLVSSTTNLVDTIWAADKPPQPSYPTNALMILDSTIYTGEYCDMGNY